MKTIKDKDLMKIKQLAQATVGHHTETGIEIVVDTGCLSDCINEFKINVWSTGDISLEQAQKFSYNLQIAIDIVEELNEKYSGAKIEY